MRKLDTGDLENKYAIGAIKDFDIDNTEKSVNKINSIIDSLNRKNGTPNLHITENKILG